MSHSAPFAGTRRIAALVVKETRQVLRDPSNIALAIVLPVVMILLFGYALSLDVTNVPIALVLEDSGPSARTLAAAFDGSPYFQPVQVMSYQQARDLMDRHTVDAIVVVPPDFERQWARGSADVQLIVHGIDANRARIIDAYTRGVVALWQAGHPAGPSAASAGQVTVVPRTLFNAAGESRYFLVPGLLVLVMTLIGALMTALVMARESERGTLESLFVTPVRPVEILLGKTIPYAVLGMMGLALCLLASRFLFHVPVRGSMLALAGVSALYLLVALGLGLLISSATKSQFVASQLEILTSILPAFMLSGFVYDIRNMPTAVQVITYLVPARYYVALLQTIFLAGDVRSLIWPNVGVLAAMALALLIAALRATRKRLA